MRLRNGRWGGRAHNLTFGEIDTFEVTCGELTVSDPCYSRLRDFRSMVVLKNVRNGKWHGATASSDEDSWGNRNAAVMAYTGSMPPSSAPWEKCEGAVGVDSGQAGIFDSNHYRRDADAEGYKHTSDPICTDEPWYSMVCDKTMSEGGGVVPGGVVSESGFGDGCYDAFVLRDNKGKVVAVKVVFIEDEDADEDEGEDECKCDGDPDEGEDGEADADE